MRKVLYSVAAFFFTANLLAQTSNVGIGTNNPQTKLQVEGAISSTPVSAAAAASVTIPDNVSIFRLTLVSGGNTTALTLNNPKEGQYLTIYNEDDNDATFAGITITSGVGVVSFNYINAFWRMVSDNQAGGTNYIKNQTSGNQAGGFRISGNGLFNGGNVGIGTTTPSGKLDVELSNANYLLYDNAPGSGIAAGTILTGGYAGTGGNGPQVRYSGAGSGFIDVGQDASGSFVVEGNDQPRLTVQNGGNVGINAPSPGGKLDVELSNGSYRLYDNPVGSGVAANTVLLGEYNATNNKAPQVRFDGAGSGFMDVGQNASGDFVVEGNDQARLTVQNTGNVGVGTSSPNSSALLDVSASNKGVLLPHVALANTSDNTTIGSPATGLIVWNTTNGSGLTPGFYYNSGSSASPTWTRVVDVNTISSSLQPLSNQTGGGLSTFSYNGSTATQIGIANQGVQTGMIANGAVTTTQILDNTITSSDMGPNSVDLSSNVVTNLLPINRGGTNSNATPTGGAIAYGNGSAHAFSAAGTTGQVLVSGGSGAPTWANPNATLTTKNINAGASSNAVTVSNGSAQVVGASDVTVDVKKNALGQDGVVSGTSSPANNNQVYGTNASGVPAWSSVSNAQLANSSVTINNGSGISGGGTVALGSSLTLNNTGVLSVGASGVLSSSGGQNPSVSLTGVVPIANGGTNASSFSANNKFVWFDGTRLVASSYDNTSFLPGTGSYIQNGTSAQSANFNITGTGNVGTLTFTAPTGDPSPVITARTVPAGQGAANERTELIMFHSNDPNNGAGDDLITLRAPSIRLQTYNDATVSDINNNAGSNDRLYVRYDGNVGIGNSAPTAMLDVNGSARIRTLGAGYVKSDASGNLSSGSIAVADIPGGSGSYVQNQNASAQSANYWVSGTGRTEGNLYVSMANTTGGGITISDDGDIADLNDGYSTHRFSYGLRIGNNNGTNSTGTAIQLASGRSGSGFTYFTGSNVGIGTTSPGNLLQVGNGGGTGKILVNSQESGYGQLQLGNPASGGEASMSFISGVTAFGTSPASTNGTSYIWDIGANNYGIGGNKFGIGNASYGGVILAVTSAGNVGIGTTSPSSKLHIVNGAPTGDQGITSASAVVIEAAGGGYTEYRSTADNNTYLGDIFVDNNLGGYVAFRNAPDDRLHIGGYSGILFEVGTDNNVGGKAERVRIDANGYLGVGTTAPVDRLDVRDAMSVNEIKFRNVGGGDDSDPYRLRKYQSASNSNELRLDLNDDADEKFTIYGNSCSGYGCAEYSGNLLHWFRADGYAYHASRLGVGTQTPGYPIEIVGGVAPGSTISYGYLNASGSVGTSSGNVAYSLVANNRIRCPEFNAYSDRRIKTIEGTVEPAASLSKIEQLNVTSFRYIDSIGYGKQAKIGFIAQELEKVFPQAVNITSDFIPNIYAQPASIKYDSLSHTAIVYMTADHKLAENDEVKIISDQLTATVKVKKILTANSFVADNWQFENDKVFVYGKRVNDFRNVDYDRIFTLNISATQELAKKLTALEKKNTELEQQNGQLQNDLGQLRSAKADASDVMQLKAQIQVLQQLMEKNGIRSEK